MNAVAGSNVTLAVSFSGAPDPLITWFKGDFPVATWTIGSDTLAVIADTKVLQVEKNGSLTFVNVMVDYTSDYTILMTKSGLGTASTNFSLTVYGEYLNRAIAWSYANELEMGFISYINLFIILTTIFTTYFVYSCSAIYMTAYHFYGFSK